MIPKIKCYQKFKSSNYKVLLGLIKMIPHSTLQSTPLNQQWASVMNLFTICSIWLSRHLRRYFAFLFMGHSHTVMSMQVCMITYIPQGGSVNIAFSYLYLTDRENMYWNTFTPIERQGRESLVTTNVPWHTG